MLQALASFPGVERIVAFHGTLQQGRSPSVFQLTIAPQARLIAGSGRLVLSFGATRVVLADCVVDSASYQFDAGGYLVGLQILDRRWKWRFPVISGRYNQTDDAGALIDSDGRSAAKSPLINSRRTPRQLARLLLEALGEAPFSIAELPNDARIQTDWDHTPAAAALADLCDQLGCRIVLGLNNRIALRRLGAGSALPNLPFVDAQLELNPDERPSAIEIVSAPILFQADLELEAVGLDTDGTIRPIDELSYKPSRGWAACDARYFAGIASAESRQLARETVYRWYRIIAPSTVPLPGGGSMRVEDRRQIIVDSAQAERDTDGDRQPRRPAWVFGIWYRGDMSLGVSSLVSSADGNTGGTIRPITTHRDAQFCDVPFSLDAANHLIRFEQPIYRIDATNHTLQSASLRLRTGFRLRDYATGALRRASLRKAVPGARGATRPLVVVREEIEPMVRRKYSASFAANGSADNHVETERLLQYHLAAQLAEFGLDDPSSKKYPGILAIELDGSLQAITWDIGLRGGFTTIQRHQDRGSPTTLPYRLRRQMERQREADDRAAMALPRINRELRAKSSGGKSL